jgi:hypothetical protein
MRQVEQDQVAQQVVELRVAFDLGLSNKRTYPVREFQAFVKMARRYIAMTASDSMMPKSVAHAINGLREFLAAERKRVPGDIIFEADWLESAFWQLRS